MWINERTDMHRFDMNYKQRIFKTDTNIDIFLFQTHERRFIHVLFIRSGTCVLFMLCPVLHMLVTVIIQSVLYRINYNSEIFRNENVAQWE